MILRLIIIFRSWLLGSLNIYWRLRFEKLITNLIIYNYTQDFRKGQKNVINSQIIAEITLIIPTISVNVKKIWKKYQNF